MHQAIEDKVDDFNCMVCPKCNRLIDTSNTRIAQCSLLGITLGYYLICDICGETTFLRFVGHPPLLDLHSSGPAVWLVPEV